MKTPVVLFFIVMLNIICVAQDTSSSNKKTYDENDFVNCGLKDSEGNLWFGTNSRGIYCYFAHGKSEVVKKAFMHFDQEEGLTTREITALVQDKTGTIWAATGDGAYRFNGERFSRFAIPVDTATSLPNERTPDFITGVRNGFISSMLCDKQGNLWFGTMTHGVYRYDGKTFTNFLMDEWIVCMAEDKAGNLWFGSQRAGGVYRYDGNSFINLRGKDGLGDNWIRCIVPDRDGSLWIGTRKNGVCHYTGNAFVMFKDDTKICVGSDPILQDKAGNIWFGGCGWGARRYDGNVTISFTTKDGLGHDRIYCMLEDNAGNIWFGGRAGSLSCFNGRSFTDFSDEIH